MSQITKNKLIKALERLLDGDVTKLASKELRNKARQGKLKINNSNVEKEAGLSAGALRRHDDVVLMIKNKSLEVQVAQDETTDSPIDVLQKENLNKAVTRKEIESLFYNLPTKKGQR